MRRIETVVFAGTQAQKLRLAPLRSRPVMLRGPISNPTLYEEGTDYVIDYDAGTVRRTEGSRIPDWRNHPMYGLDSFDHRDFPSYSNAEYTCMIEYEGKGGAEEPLDPAAKPDMNGAAGSDLMRRYLPHLHKKLSDNEPVHYVVYGDSISTGCEASPGLAYFECFADALRFRFPQAKLTVHRKALGGETSRGGLERLENDCIALQPDLVTIAYGMNDQNRQPDGTNAVLLEEFEHNIREMVMRIRNASEADVLLITPCLPNPRWIFASNNAAEYAEAIRSVGRTEHVPVADVQRIWQQELAAGKTHESLLLNNLNHPNDYGHWLYYQAMVPYLS